MWAMHSMLQVLVAAPVWPLTTCWATSKGAGEGDQDL